MAVDTGVVVWQCLVVWQLTQVCLCGSVLLSPCVWLCGSVWLSLSVVVWQAAEPAPVSPMLAVAHQALARHKGQVGTLEGACTLWDVPLV